MRYRVRSPEGELEYPSLKEVEQAYVAGLVAPEDEVLEEGSTRWRKAATIPALAQAQTRSKPSSHAQGLTILIAVVLGVFALLLVRSGRGLFALLIAMGIASLLWRVTFNAFRRKR